MGVSLSKGQSVSLVKSGGGALTQVRMGLGWDAVEEEAACSARAGRRSTSTRRRCCSTAAGSWSTRSGSSS